jgi:peptidoglycan/LPS O-acetylase OafA/YrhL
MRGPFVFRHLPFLDGLRGIAILLVMVFHLRQHVLVGGFLGVDVFFVLSGFLITSLLVEEWDRTGAVSLKQFYLRRILRLFPALAALLAFWTLWAVTLPSWADKSRIPWALGVVVFYVSNWLQAYESSLIDFRNFTRPLLHTWSLAIEEQFYLIWPVLLLFLLRRRLSVRALVASVLAGAAASAGLCAALWYAWDPRWQRVYYRSDTRADVLLIGCALGLLYTRDALPRSRGALMLLKATAALALVPMVALVLWADLTNAVLYQGGLAFFGLGVAAGMAVLLQEPPRWAVAILESRALVWIGQRSYGLYLWHWFLYKVADSEEWPQWHRILVRLLTSFAVAELSYNLVERPFLLRKDRHRPVFKQRDERIA